MNLKDLREDFEEHINNISNEQFEQELFEAGIENCNDKVILKPIEDLFIWKDVPKWKFVWWDIQYHIGDFFWKIKEYVKRMKTK